VRPNEHLSKREYAVLSGAEQRKPLALTVDVHGVPSMLRSRRQWVCWDYRLSPDGLWTKVPFQAVTPEQKASTTNPRTWTTFDAALAFCLQEGLSGIGFVLTDEDPIVFIDLDHCVDPQTGEIDEWAREVMALFATTYQEISVSRTGVHIFCAGKIPAGVRRKKVVTHPSAQPDAAIEVYETGRYATISGVYVDVNQREISGAQDALETICRQYLSVDLRPIKPPPLRVVKSVTVDVADRLGKARQSRNGGKFAALFDRGDVSLYGGDHSAADLALCCILAFWLDLDPVKIEETFTASALMREKWDAKRGPTTYGRYTIAKALELVQTCFGDGGGEYYDVPDLVVKRAATAEIVADDNMTDDNPEPEIIEAPPPFPMDALPPVAREFVRIGGRARGNTPDFIAVPLLGCIGAAVGNKIRVHIKEGFEEFPTGWFAIVGDSGTAKSTSIDYAMSGLHAIQDHLRNRYDLDLIEWNTLDKKDREKAPAPRMKSVYTTDATMEAVAEMLSLRNGLTIVADELSSWLESFDAYRKGGGDRQKWLTMESGGTIKIDRKTGPSFYVRRPACSVVSGTQPDKLFAIRADGADDGFAQRLLLTYPDSNIPRLNRHLEDDPAVRQDMITVFERLFAIEDRPHVITFTHEAFDVLDSWDEENAAIIEQSTGLARGWASKAVKSLARMALILHCLREERPHQTQISAKTVSNAIQVIEYFRRHFIRCLPLLGIHGGLSAVNVDRETSSNAHRIFKALKERAGVGEGWVSQTDLRRIVKVTAEEFSTATDALLAESAITFRTVEGAGRVRKDWKAI
jgi:putative DNA primase/helicase